MSATSYHVHRYEFAPEARRRIPEIIGPDAASAHAPAHQAALILDALYHYALRGETNPDGSIDFIRANENLQAAGLYERITGERPGWMESQARVYPDGNGPKTDPTSTGR